MFSMRVFHEWLSSTGGTPSGYRRHLALLTQATRPQIQKLQSDVAWTIWWAD